MNPAANPRIVRASSETTELSNITGRLLFPTLHQGPWLPLKLLAESATRGPCAPDLHTHVSEEVILYVLAGGLAEVDPTGGRIESGEGSVRIHASGEEFLHDVVPLPGRLTRWVSLVLSLPKGSTPVSSPSRVFPPSSPKEVAPGAFARALVGGAAEARSQLGAEISSLEFRDRGTVSLDVPSERRAVVYVAEGRGTILGERVRDGDGILTEGVGTLEVEAEPGFRGVFVTVAPPAF